MPFSLKVAVWRSALGVSVSVSGFLIELYLKEWKTNFSQSNVLIKIEGQVCVCVRVRVFARVCDFSMLSSL